MYGMLRDMYFNGNITESQLLFVVKRKHWITVEEAKQIIAEKKMIDSEGVNYETNSRVDNE